MLYDLINQNFYVSRDVQFRESIYSFENGKPDRPIYFEHPVEIYFTKVIIPRNVQIEESDIDDVIHSPHDKSVYGSDGIQVPPIKNITVPTLCRFGRAIRAPTWMKDYHVSNSSSTYPIENFISYDKLSDLYQCYLTCISKLV